MALPHTTATNVLGLLLRIAVVLVPTLALQFSAVTFAALSQPLANRGQRQELQQQCSQQAHLSVEAASTMQVKAPGVRACLSMQPQVQLLLTINITFMRA